ncbi:MAG: SusC/RagA family TonB-linked outer membrane protein [Saprospiraceae bacterium]
MKIPQHFIIYWCFLISLCCLPVVGHTATKTQNNFQKKTIPLSKAIDEVANVYQVNIVYDVEQIAGKKINDWSIQHQSVEAELKELQRKSTFNFKKLGAETYIIKVETATITNKGISTKINQKQPQFKITKAIITVSGSVYDIDNNEPLIGVNILVKGKDVGTATDFDGKFSLEVEENATLVFSYIGYNEKEVKVRNAKMGDIYLETDAKQLEEVVVVGYGTQKRSDLTGALSSVGEKEIKALPATGLDQALQGRAAGVQVTQNSGAPGGGVSIRIRGIGSTLSAEPLYVIDGIPVVNDNQGTSSNFSELDGGGQNSNALNTVNPSDIESIEILKDASATAIYGARAANGVVLITTKRGKAGKSNISLESYYGVQELASKVPVLDLRQYAEYYGDIGFELIEEFRNPELLGKGTDWQDAVFRQAATQNYQMTVSGGSEKTKFALSGGYNFKEGIVVGSDFTRLSAKLNIDHSFSDRVRIGNSFLASRTSENITFNDNSSGVVYTALLAVPNAPVRNADGSFAGPQEEITLSFDNPVARALETQDVNTKTRILSNLYAEIDLFPWLKYRTEFGADIIYSNHNTFFPQFERGNFFGKSGVRRSLNNSLFWINKHLLTFNKKIADKHNVTALLGFEAQEGTYEYLFASRDNLPTNDLQQLSLGDAGQQQNGGGAGHWALVSYFGRFNYGFSDRYLLTGTVRVDGSSRFGPNNRYGVFPSAAFAWRASNEGFIKEIDAINNLKFRVGVGTVGNQEIGLYSYSANLRSINVALGDQLVTGFAPDNIANPDVRWESSFQTNIGMDLGLINNRIELIADYYIKKADGMLLPALIPLTAGSLNAPFVNIGEIENRGIEITLNTQNTTGAFSWRTGINFSVNRNKVISLGSNGNLIGLIQRIPVTRTEEGQPISQFYGYVTDGIFQSQAEVVESPFQQDGTRAGDIKFKDLNNDGIINDQDQTFLGSPHPDFTLNMTNNFSYKGIDFSFFFQGVFGNEILNLIRRDIEGMAGLANQSVRVIDRSRPGMPDDEMPRATGPDPNSNRRISSRFIEDGTFVRLKNVSLGYTFPKKWMRRVKIQTMRAYISVQNLQTWTDYSGYDPEIGSYNQNPLINGVENGRYPISRSYTAGINVNF